MAFPDVTVECAFDNDVNELLYAQTGYSDITPWVRVIEGDLRGRRYEMDRNETGTLRITLDNSDRRFTPNSPISPYFPFVKPSRRLRIRGNNLQRLNIATAGSALQHARGFIETSEHAAINVTEPEAIESGASSPLWTLEHENEILDPRTTATTNWSGSANTTRSITADGFLRNQVSVSQNIASVFATLAGGAKFSAVTGNKVFNRVRVHGHSAKTLWVRTGWDFYNGAAFVSSASGAWIELPMEEEVTLTLAGTIAPASVNGVHPFVQFASTSNGSGTVVAGDYVDITGFLYEHDTLALSTASDLYFDGDLTDETSPSAKTLSYNWTGTVDASKSQQYSRPMVGGSHHVEATVSSGAVAGTYGLFRFNVPIELLRRVVHSFYIWKVSGTEPTGTVKCAVYYYDSDGVVLATVPLSSASLPVGTTPTRKFIAHAAPVTAAFAMMEVWLETTATTATAITYALDEVMSNNAPSMAVNPSGMFDADGWYVTGDSDTVVGTNVTDSALSVTMAADGTDLELYTYVNGTVPGETYTVAMELRHFTAAMGTPSTSLILSANEGQTGTVVTGQGAYSTAVLTFTAQSTSQKLSIALSDGSAFPASWVVRARRMAVIQGSISPGLYTSGSTHDLVSWEAPRPIFEGWVENWPVRVENSANEITVSVNDRLQRIGAITLDNTWREALFADKMELMVPFDDDPVDANNKAAQIGLWASTEQFIDLPAVAAKGDIGAASIVFGVDGPTDATAVEFNPISSGLGYMFPVPYSKDYTAPAAPPPPPPAPKPTPTTPTYTTKQYVKTYYATWSRTYEGNNATTWDDNALMYQGYWSDGRGNTKSLAGFNWSAIKADLSGATIVSCKVTFQNEESYSFGGSTILVGTHNYSSKPSTWNGANVVERRKSLKHTYGQKTVVVDLGTTIGNEFKAGTTRGIAVGPPSSTDRYYYSKYRGATQSGKPYLTITYTKKVAV